MFRLKVIGLFLFLLLAGCENFRSKADQIKILEAEITMCNENMAKFDRLMADSIKETGSIKDEYVNKFKKYREQREDAEKKLHGLLSKN